MTLDPSGWAILDAIVVALCIRWIVGLVGYRCLAFADSVITCLRSILEAQLKETAILEKLLSLQKERKNK